jgi:PST family polysaccharide transporter
MDSKWVNLLPSFIGQHLRGRSYLQNVLNNIGWLFTEKILQIVIALFVGVWLARYLQPGAYGNFNYAIAFVALFSPLATLGLDGIIVRNLVKDPSKKEKILGTAFYLRLGGSCASIFIIYSAILLLRPKDNVTHWLVGILGAGLVFQAFDIIRFWFESQVQSKYIVYARNTAFCTTAFVKVVLILIHASLIAFAWAVFAEIILSAAGFAVAYHLKGNRIKLWKWDYAEAKSLIRDSWPLFLSGLAIIIYMKIDQVMLGNMLGDKEVGIYSAAVRISEVWYFIPLAIVSSVSPSIVEAKIIGEDLYYQRIGNLFRFMAGIAYGIALLMTLFSNPLVSLLFGPNYAGAGPVLAIHTWASIFVFLGVARGPWIVNEGLMKLSLYSSIIGAVINITLNLLLIPGFGVIGAAIATLLSYGVSGFLFNGFLPATRNIFYMQIRALLLIPMVKKK